MSFTASQIAILDNMRLDLKSAGLNLGTVLSALSDAVNSGNLGITALARDVDAVALDGNALAQDVNNTTGLYWAYFAGVINWQGTLVAYAANGGAPLLLSASTTNYVEALPNGTIVKNTVGWTAGYVPLWQITTNGSAITAVVRKRPVISTVGLAGIVGSLLSTAGKTKEIAVYCGTINATTTIRMIAPSAAAKLSKLAIVVATTVATDNTNKWTFTALNKGTNGSGSTALLAPSGNDTSTTGGVGLTADAPRTLALHGTTANLDFAGGEGMQFVATKGGTAADLVGATVIAEWTFVG